MMRQKKAFGTVRFCLGKQIACVNEDGDTLHVGFPLEPIKAPEGAS